MGDVRDERPLVSRASRVKSILLAAFSAIALAALTGCPSKDGKDGEGAEPESYMKDPEFRATLDKHVAKRGELAVARNTVVAKMTEMIEAKKKELGTDDEAKLKEALEKDPAWNELYKRCQDANTALGDNRRAAMAAVREKMLGKREEGAGKR